MKRTTGIGLALGLIFMFLLASSSHAAIGSIKSPFNELWDAVKKLEKKIDLLSLNVRNCCRYPGNNPGDNNGGLKKVVITGNVPDNITEADLEAYVGGGDDDHYYFKKVEIPEIQLSNAPKVTLYTKIDEEVSDILGDGFWEESGNFYIKDGAVYIRYANDDEDEGIHYSIPGDGSYKIVVIY